MLRRPDAPRGSEWMRKLDERMSSLAGGVADPATPGRKPHFVYWIPMVIVFVWIFAGPKWQMYPRSTTFEPYESEMRIAGVPLYAYGESPRGIVAVGAFPRGLIAIGGLPVGLVAVGGLALGGVAISGLAAGIFAIGGLALGWWATGGGAIGYYAFGGLAVGGHAYAGNGVAYGHYEASGRQKEALFG